jgi:hypothetical protein
MFSPPFLKPNRMLHADDLLQRGVGTPSSTATNRDAELLVLDQQELDASTSRTENWMCSQTLFTGKVSCYDYDSGERLRSDQQDRPCQAMERPDCGSACRSQGRAAPGQRSLRVLGRLHLHGQRRRRCVRSQYEGSRKLQQGSYPARRAHRRDCAVWRRLAWHLARNQSLRLRGAIRRQGRHDEIFRAPTTKRTGKPSSRKSSPISASFNAARCLRPAAVATSASWSC